MLLIGNITSDGQERFRQDMILAYVVAGIIGLLAAAAAVVWYGASGQRDIGPNGYALPTVDDGTGLDRKLIAQIRNHDGKSGIRIVHDDLEAFRFRLDLAREAGRSLDLQYYYWKSDVTGKLLAREILAAAERGVRVRLMLDDINSMGLDSTIWRLTPIPKSKSAYSTQVQRAAASSSPCAISPPPAGCTTSAGLPMAAWQLSAAAT
jgi:hypothetical protein